MSLNTFTEKELEEIMEKFTELTREKIFVDAKTQYLKTEGRVFGKEHLNFCRQYAGKRILDFGCATGDYCLELKKLGFECVGVDINERYIEIAREKGVEAYVIKEHLPFEDRSFATVILIEVLEHVPHPGKVLEEAKRVARKNILITVPDCGGFETLKNYGLTYGHFLAIDHINFFTKKELEDLLSKSFKKFQVEERGEIALGKLGLPWWLRKPIALLYKLKIIKTNIYYNLFAVVDLEEEG